MRKLALIVVLLICGIANADTLKVFSLQDFVNTDSRLDGTIWVDVTNGLPLFGFFTYTYYGEFGEYRPGVTVSIAAPIQTYGCRDCFDHPDELQLIASGPGLHIHFGTPSSLVDWTGDLCWNGANYGAVTCSYDNYSYASASFHLPEIYWGGNHTPAMDGGDFDDFFNRQSRLRLCCWVLESLEQSELRTNDEKATNLFRVSGLGLFGFYQDA